MLSLANEITIDAPADRVWEIAAHRFDRIGEWATVIPSSVALQAPTLPGAPVAGRVCETGVRGVPRVTETIVEYDEAGRTLTYAATAGLPAFVTLARNTWRVTPVGDGQARVSYSGRIEVRGLLGRLARRLLLARVARDGRHLLDDLKHYAEHGEVSPRKLADPVAAVGIRPTSATLRAALRAHATLALLGGLTMLTAGWWWSAILPLVGAALAGLGLGLARLAVAPAAPLRRLTRWLIAADLALLLYLVSGPPHIAVGAVVAVLTLWQLIGLAALRRHDPLADTETIEASRVFAAAPQRMWPLLTDHRRYGHLAPNLSSVEVISPPGETLRRRCTNKAGQHWEETCTPWQDGRRFAVEVDTTDYPYPLQSIRGLWQVDSHPRGSRVTMRFAYRAKASVRGGLFAIALRLAAPHALRRILNGWQRELLQ